jgi:hypothetical protein
LCPRSQPPDCKRRLGSPLRWSGPALGVIGAAVVGAVVLRPAAVESPLAWWIQHSVLTPERVLPLIGLGVTLGLVRTRAFSAGLLLFCTGIVAGFILHNQLLAPFWAIPNAAAHQFFTGPIGSIAVGLSLIAGARLRPRILPPIALLAGVMLALAITVTDPSLHDPTNRGAGVLIAAWVVGAVSLSLRAFRRHWFMIAGPILGSWLIAIGLLYGGAALLPKPVPPSPSLRPSGNETPYDDTQGGHEQGGDGMPSLPQ